MVEFLIVKKKQMKRFALILKLLILALAVNSIGAEEIFSYNLRGKNE